MATSTLGNKFTCFMCQCKFYDLNRAEAVCPRCKANQKEQPKPKATGGRSRAVEKAKVKEVVVYNPPEEETTEATDGPPHPAAEDPAAEEEEDDEDA